MNGRDRKNDQSNRGGQGGGRDNDHGGSGGGTERKVDPTTVTDWNPPPRPNKDEKKEND